MMSDWVVIDSGNRWWPILSQDITWTNADLLSIWPQKYIFHPNALKLSPGNIGHFVSATMWQPTTIKTIKTRLMD